MTRKHYSVNWPASPVRDRLAQAGEFGVDTL